MVLVPGPGNKLAASRNRFLLCHFFVAGERPWPDARLCGPFGEVGMKRNPIRVALGLALVIGAFSNALAQFSGSISGTVTDPAGAVIPGATVTLTNAGTGEGKTATTDGSGFYQFVSMAPGNYALKTSAKGFADTRQGFTLETNQTMNLPVKVTVG